MPKYSELERRIRRETRWRFNQHLSDHDEWIDPVTKDTVTIPRHKSQEVPKGTLNQILKKVGLK